MNKLKTEVVVVGAGPGGYAAAFYAADLGKSVILVEQDSKLGGICLNHGCIPSKALLHAAQVLSEAKAAHQMGIDFGPPKIKLDAMRAWKDGILSKLSGGIKGLAEKRGVKVITGRGHFEDTDTLRVENKTGQQFIHFENAIIAVGSRPALPAVFDLGNKRIMTSTEALELEDIPQKLLVVGGGYIGMELGTVYAALGSEITLVEAHDTILAGADSDLIRPVITYAKTHFKEVRLGAKVQKLATSGKKIKVKMTVGGKSVEESYDRVLVSIGRVPNNEDLGLENAGAKLSERGFIEVNTRQQTSAPHIYAIGDIAGGVMLAHKASKEARIAVEVICGQPSEFKNILIPAVVFTHPEVAWVGLTETEAKAMGIPIKVAKFPWAASGRALTLEQSQGLTKLIIDPTTERVLGAGIVGYGAGDLIGEAILAIEMHATVHDIALSVHPHPTLSETLMEAAEVFFGHSSHVFTPHR
jgi:dihydrolipoamide dehydrogenase